MRERVKPTRIASVALSLLVLFPIAAGCEEILRVSLEDAVRLAFERNSDVVRARERLEELEGTREEVLAAAFPQLTWSAGADRSRNPGILNSPTVEEIPEEVLGGFAPQPVTIYNTSLRLDQPIYSSGKTSHSLRAARKVMEQAETNISEARRNLAFDVTGLYYDALLARSSIKVLKKQKEHGRRHFEMTSVRFDIGDATRLELLQAKAALENIEPRLIRAVNRYDDTLANLNFLMRRRGDAPLVLTETLDGIPPVRTPSKDFLIATALERRPDLVMSHQEEEFLEEQVKITKTNLYPKFSLFGEFGRSSLETDNLLRSDYDDWMVGIDVKLNLFDGFRTRGKVKQLHSRIVQERIKREKKENLIALEIENALREMERAGKSLEASDAANRTSKEALRVAQENYAVGAATNLELLDGERALLQSELDLAEARRDLLLSVARLKWLAGIPLYEPFPVPPKAPEGVE